MLLFPIILSALTSFSVHAQDSKTTSALQTCEKLIRAAVALEASKVGKREPVYQLSEPISRKGTACTGPHYFRTCYPYTVDGSYSFTSSVFESESHDGYVAGSGFVADVTVKDDKCIFETPTISWGK